MAAMGLPVGLRKGTADTNGDAYRVIASDPSGRAGGLKVAARTEDAEEEEAGSRWCDLCGTNEGQECPGCGHAQCDACSERGCALCETCELCSARVVLLLPQPGCCQCSQAAPALVGVAAAGT